MKRKRSFLPVLMLCILLFILSGTSAVYAYYSANHSLANRLITKGSGVVLQELFNRDDKWLPGETKTKEVWFGNENETAQVIRFRADSAWTDSAGNAFAADYTPELHWTAALVGADGVATTLDAGQQWIKIGDYYYYNRVLQPRTDSGITRTDAVLTAVTFDGSLSNDVGHAKDYSNKTYSLTIAMEAVDVDTSATAAAWDMNFTNTGGALVWTPAT